MKLFWSWQSDTPEQIGKYLVRDALKAAIDRLKEADDIEEPTRDDLHLDQDTQGTTGSPDLVPTIFGKIEKSEVVVADVTIIGKTDEGKGLINSNVAIELGYALHACTDARVVLVFNRHYGTHENLPFDLRHKGGAVVFDLAPEADRKQIAAVRKSLADDFGRKLKPFLQQPRIKEALSVRAVIEHRLQRSYRLPNGGSDDVFELLVSLKNDGEQAAPDFKLQVEIPSEFIDGAGPVMRSRPANPGFSRFEITNEDALPRMKYLYPNTTTQPVFTLNYAVKDETKRQHPEQLEKNVTATVYSGSMRAKETTMTIAELALIPKG
ncbi:MAG: hypothetical protein LAO18_07215 [Acidobacteriia bacterium]|nr:hypothetical protein [Terriglobia bacterium]